MRLVPPRPGPAAPRARPWPLGPVAIGLVAAALTACGPDRAGPVAAPAGSGVLDLAAPGSMETLRAGEVDLADPAQRGLALGGWHLDELRKGPRPGVWSSSAEPALYLPLGRVPAGDALLHVSVIVPGFHAPDFELGLTLNGTDLGRRTLPAGAGLLTYELAPGLLTAGLNRLDFATTPTVVPADRGAGKDTRELGFDFRGARVTAADLVPGPLLHRRLVPAEGAGLEWRVAGAGAHLVVQDDRDGALVTARDLAQPAGHLSLATADGAAALRLVLDPGSAAATGTDPGAAATGAEPGAAPATGVVEALTLTADRGFTDVVVIVVDTLRADALRFAEAPVLQALGAESVVFERCFAHAPITLPSHTALFSARLPHETGIVNNGQAVPAELPLLADVLHERGWRGLAAVSLGTLWYQWHAEGDGLERGFQLYEAAVPYDSYAGMTQPVVRDLVDGLEADQPLFLFAHYADPHEPYRSLSDSGTRTTVSLDGVPLLEVDPAAAPYLEQTLPLEAGTHRLTFASPGVETQLRLVELKDPAGRVVPFQVSAGRLLEPSELQEVTFELAEPTTLDVLAWVSDHPRRDVRFQRYAEEVALADAAIGALIDQLREAGRWDDALVIFTSDHGEGLGQHGMAGHVDGLFDEQLHVPLFVKLPAGPAWDAARARLEAGRERLVRLTDVAPTVLELLGLPPMPEADGASLLDPDLAAGPSRVALSQTHQPEARRDAYSLRDERFKLLYFPAGNRFHLYDLEADPREEVDIFPERGDEVAVWQVDLRDLARAWSRDGSVDADAELRARLEALGY